jgi:hypothetical protein
MLVCYISQFFPPIVCLVVMIHCITEKLLKVKINTNIQLLPSYDANIERCQPEDGCFDNLIVYLI